MQIASKMAIGSFLDIGDGLILEITILSISVQAIAVEFVIQVGLMAEIVATINRRTILLEHLLFNKLLNNVRINRICDDLGDSH